MSYTFDQSIALQQRGITPNSLGEEVEGWSDWIANCPARVVEGQGREFLKGGQMQAEERVVFVTRWLGTTATSRSLRATWAGRTWNVEQVTGTLRSGESWLHCHAIDGAN